MAMIAVSGLLGSFVPLPIPVGITQIDALRRAQIGQGFVPLPGGNAVDM